MYFGTRVTQLNTKCVFVDESHGDMLAIQHASVPLFGFKVTLNTFTVSSSKTLQFRIRFAS